MAYETLKSDIQSYVKQNGGGAITGDGLQSILLEIVNTLGTGFKYVGVATPSTSPGTPTENVFYIGGGGIYANFGSTIEVEAYQICVFAYNGSWSKSVINVGSSFDVEDYPAGAAVEFTFYSAETPDGRSIKINKDVSGLSNEPDEAISQWWAAQKERKINLIAGYTIDFDSLDASSPSSLGVFKAIQAGQIIDSYTNATSLIFGTDGGQSVTINKSQLPYTATANLINVKSASGTLSNVSIKVRGSLENMPSYININEIANHPAAYANAAAALADVPEIYRRKGTKVVYYDDDTQTWIEMLCYDDAGGANWWTDVNNNWAIEGPIETKLATATGGQQLQIAGEKRGNLDDVLNVNVWNEQIYEYESKADARAAVPANKRKLGGVITYLIDGMWYTEQFIGSSTSTWTTTESDWKVLGPVSVSQNSQTGKTELKIGGDVAFTVDKEIEYESNNLIISGAVAKKLGTQTLTEVTGLTTLLNLKYNSTSGLVETGANSQKVKYYLFENAYRVKITGTYTNITQAIYIGITDEIPSDGVTVSNVITLYTTTINEYVDVPAGKYLCLFWNASYTLDVSYYISENHEYIPSIISDISDINEQINPEVANIIDDMQQVNKLNYNPETGKFETSTSNNAKVKYRLFTSTTRVKITGTYTNAGQPIYIGVADSAPANDVALSNVVTLYTTTLNEYVDVPAGKYLCLKWNGSYTLTVTYYTVVDYTLNVPELIADIDELQANMVDTQDLRNHFIVSQYDGLFVDVAYSSLWRNTTPPNSESHFLRCIETGFRALKADMRLTSDNKIVLCHDAGYTFDNNGYITTFDDENYTAIHDMTLTEIQSKVFAVKTTEHPCTLDTFLFICKKYSCIPFITLRNETWSATTVDVMYQLLQKYGLVSKVIINLFPANTTLCGLIRAKNKNIIMCDTRLSNVVPTIERIDGSAELGCTITGYQINPTVGGVVQDIATYLTTELLSHAASKNVRIWGWNINTGGSTQIDGLIQIGLVGIQNSSPNPLHPAT